MAPPKLSWSDTVCQVASLTLANAFIFQEELAAHNRKVKTLAQLLKSKSLITDAADHWTFIVDEINYVPIFKISRDILRALPSSADPAIRALARTAQQIVSMRAALRHDLMGRIYHRLLLEAKYLGTYYTSISSATLLLKLTMAPEKWAVDWADPESISGLRIADPASGTGTLLMAAVQAVGDNHVRLSAAGGKTPDLVRLHGVLMESVLYGFDVVPSALHLTASTLALLAPEIAFKRMNLYSLPLGGPGRRLGSIDFLEVASISVQQDLFGAKPTQTRVTGKGSVEVAAEMPQLDLAVMNPPFTRSVGGNLLFGSLPEKEREKLQEHLREVLRQPGILAQSTAGLAPVFIALGDRFLKPGGRQALVLPRAILSGVAWRETRQLLSQKYDIEYVIVSHDPDRWSFSENTSLSEALVIARKRCKGDPPRETVLISLWRNPTEPVAALAVADAIQHTQPAPVHGRGLARIRSGGSEVGEAILAPFAALGDRNWWHHAYAQTELVRVADGLMRGILQLPAERASHAFPSCRLADLGELGPDRRDVNDGFTVADARTSYPAFWGHREENVQSLEQTPNAYLAGRTKAAPGRPLRDPALLWSRSGRLVLAERLRLNTQRLVAVCLPEDVLSNVWWPFRLRDQIQAETGLRPEAVAKILALWLNSTVGLLAAWAQREDTEGAWVGMKKPTWSELPVLDPRRLSADQVRELCRLFDSHRGSTWGHWPDMESDETRAAVDVELARALGLPDFGPLRAILAREPIVCLKSLGGAPSQAVTSPVVEPAAVPPLEPGSSPAPSGSKRRAREPKETRRKASRPAKKRRR